jgi:hypothetical protein
MTIKKVSATHAKGRRGATDWKKVKSMTDEEIRRSAISDPSAKELKNDELVKFRRGNR